MYSNDIVQRAYIVLNHLGEKISVLFRYCLDVQHVLESNSNWVYFTLAKG